MVARPELLAAIEEADRLFAKEGGVSMDEARHAVTSWNTEMGQSLDFGFDTATHTSKGVTRLELGKKMVAAMEKEKWDFDYFIPTIRDYVLLNSLDKSKASEVAVEDFLRAYKRSYIDLNRRLVDSERSKTIYKERAKALFSREFKEGDF